MDTFLYRLTNSGLYFYRGGMGILVDGLYGRGPYQCFSPFPEELHRDFVEKRGIFAHLNGVLFTHSHGDHVDSDMLFYVRQNYEKCWVYGYGFSENTLHIEKTGKGIWTAEFPSFSVVLIDTVHEGMEEDRVLFGVKHCMVLFRTEDRQILLTADAVLGEREADILESFGQIDLVFCNPIQLATRKKHEFFHRIRPGRILITHLPEKKDDSYDYWGLAGQQCRKLSFGGIHPEISHPLEWLDGHSPDWNILDACSGLL